MRPVPVKNRLKIAVEDRFIILKLRQDKALLPEGDLLDFIAPYLGSFDETYSILCDWRGLQNVTYDVIDFVELLCSEFGATILAEHKDVDEIHSCLGSQSPILEVRRRSAPLSYSDLDLDLFEDDKVSLLRKYRSTSHSIKYTFPDENEWDMLSDIDEIIYEFDLPYAKLVEDYQDFFSRGADIGLLPAFPTIFRRRYLDRLLKIKGRNSLLTEFTFQIVEDNILVTPYHAHALHSIEFKDQMMLGRPGVIAEKTGSLLSQEIFHLESLLRNKKTKEADLQSFLTTHPQIFKAVGYQSIYPQVVLQRSDGTSLRPDFILEPIAHDWCDILDLKLPDMTTVVGTKDRKTLSAYIHELAAQLREYGAYFEDERLAKRVEQLFGIKCYKPRLIGVVGRDPRFQDERQLRRLMTSYSDVSIITFDQLLRIAKSRMLI